MTITTDAHNAIATQEPPIRTRVPAPWTHVTLKERLRVSANDLSAQLTEVSSTLIRLGGSLDQVARQLTLHEHELANLHQRLESIEQRLEQMQ